ncbi:MAG: hypothetical protein M1815_000578 [Lichina confinis]|nr:MAG: hypothetical protein M1815_000578 [Lichina confinis]
MEKAKAAVSDFIDDRHKTGHHDTTVHENVAPAVVNETVKKTRHDEIQTAVVKADDPSATADREVHQDHHHTTVQPIKDREVLPETHKHHVAPVQERHLDHGNDADIRRRLEQERARFHDTRVEAPTVQSQSTAPTVAGEHVHHHVHETIQPVLQKEVIQPTVVHTTVPVHEVHHKEPVHHTASALPAVSLSDYQRQGGTLSGRNERIDGFEGEPKAVAAAIGGTPLSSSTGHTGTTGVGAGAPRTHRRRSSSASSSDREKVGGSRRNPLASGTTGTGYNTTTGHGDHGLTGGDRRHVGTDGPIGSTDAHNTTHADNTGPRHKSNMLNKLDPRVDANYDGKAGVGK